MYEKNYKGTKKFNPEAYKDAEKTMRGYEDTIVRFKDKIKGFFSFKTKPSPGKDSDKIASKATENITETAKKVENIAEDVTKTAKPLESITETAKKVENLAEDVAKTAKTGKTTIE